MAKQLYNDLKRYDLDVWLDMESLLPGDRWRDKIQKTVDSIISLGPPCLQRIRIRG